MQVVDFAGVCEFYVGVLTISVDLVALGKIN